MTDRRVHFKNRLRHREVYWALNLLAIVALLAFALR